MLKRTKFLVSMALVTAMSMTSVVAANAQDLIEGSGAEIVAVEDSVALKNSAIVADSQEQEEKNTESEIITPVDEATDNGITEPTAPVEEAVAMGEDDEVIISPFAIVEKPALEIKATPVTLPWGSSNPFTTAEACKKEFVVAAYNKTPEDSSTAKGLDLLGDVECVGFELIDTKIPGPYYLTFSIPVLNGAPITGMGVVMVEENEAPQITLSIPDYYEIPIDPDGAQHEVNKYVESVYDKEDTSLEVTNVKCEPEKIDITKPGATYTVTYTLSDSGGKSDQKTVTFKVADNAPPVLTLKPKTVTLPINSGTPVNKAYLMSFIDELYDDVDDRATLEGETSLVIAPEELTEAQLSVPGASYTIVYTVKDSLGQSTTAKLTIKIDENTPPELVLKQDSVNIPINSGITVDEAYLKDFIEKTYDKEDSSVEASKTALENSLKISPKTLTEDQLNKPGASYIITYTITDSHGQPATANLTVNIGNNNPPELVLKQDTVTIPTGSGAVTLDFLKDFIEKIYDEEDGDSIKNKLVINPNGLTEAQVLVAGETYIVVYTITDSIGQQAIAKLTVKIGDNTPPELELTTKTLTLNVNEEINLKSLIKVARDKEDGYSPATALKGKVEVNPAKIDTSVEGAVYTVNYTLVDDNGAVAKEVCTIKILNNTPPELELINETLELPINAEFDPMTNIKIARDKEDGPDLTEDVKAVPDKPFDSSVAGSTYTYVYTLTDKNGATTTATCVVTIVKNVEPVLELVSDVYELPLSATSFEPTSIITIASDYEDGNDLKIKVTWASDKEIQFGVPGSSATYTYTLIDENGAKVQATCLVKVVENVEPELELSAESIEIPLNEDFEPLSLVTIARDKEDGYADPLASKKDVKVSPEKIDTKIPGASYTLTYTLIDSYGAKVQKQCVVTVVENTPPELELVSDVYELALDEIAFYPEDIITIARDKEDGYDTALALVKTNVTWVADKKIQFGVAGSSATYTYTITDKNGATTTKKCVVKVVDNTAPELKLSTTAIAIPFNTEGFEPRDLIIVARDKEDKYDTLLALKDEVNIISNKTFNPKKAGDYVFTYTLVDKMGAMTQEKCTVTVEEKSVKPELEVDEKVTIAWGEAFDPLSVVSVARDKEDDYSSLLALINNVSYTSLPRFNNKIAGVYTFTYKLKDKDGKTAKATCEVTVEKNEAPILTLVEGPITITKGDVFGDAEMRALVLEASDKEDGPGLLDLLKSVVIDGSNVNVNKAGTYTIKYNLKDSGGLTATPVSLTVNVVDAPNTKPELVVNPTASVPLNGTFDPLSVVSVARDKEDDYSSPLALIGQVSYVTDKAFDTSVGGEYTFSYTLKDSLGKTATATCIVTVAENTLPELEVSGKVVIPWGGEFDPLSVVSVARDKEDDYSSPLALLDKVAVKSDASFDNQISGEYTFIYTLTDSNGATVEKACEVIVEVLDNTPPVLTVSSPVEIYVGATFGDAEKKALIAEAWDKEDNATGKLALLEEVVIFGTVNTAKEGTYTLGYKLTDKAGEETIKYVEVNVVAVPNNAPELVVNETATVEFGGEFDPLSVVTVARDMEDNYDSKLALLDKVTFESEPKFDSNVSGDYTFTYTLTDNGGLTTTDICVVTVGEKPASQLSLNLVETTKSIVQGTAFGNVKRLANIASATLSDGTAVASADYANYVAIKVSPRFNKDVPGKYTFTYTLTDPSNGATVTATLELTVLSKDEVTSPVLTLTETIKTIKQGTAFGTAKRLANVASALLSDGTAIDPASYGDYIKVKANPVFDRNTPGKYTFTYTLTDPSNAATATATLELTVEGEGKVNTPPVLKVNPTATVNLNATFDPLSLVTEASDAEDGADLKDKVEVVSNTVNTAKAGEYTVTYSLTDSAGETVTATSTVTVKAATTNTVPVLKVNSTATVALNSTFDPLSQVTQASDAEDGPGTLDLLSTVTVSGATVNTAKAGRYTVIYALKDSYGNSVMAVCSVTVK